MKPGRAKSVAAAGVAVPGAASAVGGVNRAGKRIRFTV
jgi:hypothetical protein